MPDKKNDMHTQADSTAEYKGQCAFALSTGKKGVEGKEKHRLQQDGRTYLFSNPIAKILWRILPGRKGKADSHWNGQ